ncbi:hypothetical protein BH18THE2_BH18THE2_36160 [soil metagenome]
MINKPAIITFMLLLAVTGGTIAISIPVLSSDAQGQGEPSNRNTTSASRTINVTIGDLILESSGLPIRVLDIGGDKGPTIEVSYVGNATIRGGINATDMGTVWSITNPDGTIYGKGNGTLTSKATGEMATYAFQAVGQYGPDGKLRNRGSVFFNTNTSSSGQLSFLNNMVGVYADETVPAANAMTKIWELR